MLCDFKITINRIEALVRQLEKEEGREREREKKKSYTKGIVANLIIADKFIDEVLACLPSD